MQTPADGKSDDPPALDVSVVVPLYLEEESVSELTAKLIESLTPLERSFEIILVDDGSRDGTPQEIDKAAKTYPQVRGVFLARNYGQTTAMQAGFDAARGDAVVTLDGDLQNDPADIPRLLKMLDENAADLVSGWRKDRHDGKLRVLFSNVANRLISAVTGVRLHDYGCSMKAYRRSYLENVRIYGEMHRFLPAVLADVGARIVETPVNHRPRKFGRSKYGFDRTFRVLLDLLLIKFMHKYLDRPIHFFGGLGIILMVPGFAISAYLAFLKIFFHESIGGRPLLMLGVFLMLTGVVLITQGLIGELVIRVLFQPEPQRRYRLRPSAKSRNPAAPDADGA